MTKSEANPIRFDDGAGYEEMMGKWSQLAGTAFLDWINPAQGQRWVDVGCGNGAFTDLISARCAPLSIDAIDPSEGQLAYARERPGSRMANFRQGDAQQLPYADNAFDIAVMALVIFFVPDPVKGASELVRVVRPGGTVCAYAWDILNGGFPLDALQQAMRDQGMSPVLPPSAQVSPLDALHALWGGAGLDAVESTSITVQRTFPSVDEYWRISLLGSSIGPKVAAMTQQRRAGLKAALHERLQPAPDGSLTIEGRANAVRGVVPA